MTIDISVCCRFSAISPRGSDRSFDQQTSIGGKEFLGTERHVCLDGWNFKRELEWPFEAVQLGHCHQKVLVSVLG